MTQHCLLFDEGFILGLFGQVVGQTGSCLYLGWVFRLLVRWSLASSFVLIRECIWEILLHVCALVILSVDPVLTRGVRYGDLYVCPLYGVRVTIVVRNSNH